MKIELNGNNDGRQHAAEYPNTWDAIPANGKRCRYSGMGHSRFYQFLKSTGKNHVRTISLKEPGQARGTRLFHVGDLLRFLDSMAKVQSMKNVGGHQ